MDSFTLAKLIFAIGGGVLIPLHVRREGLHFWSVLIALTAACVLAAHVFSWSALIQWLAWAAWGFAAFGGMGKAVAKELKRNRSK